MKEALKAWHLLRCRAVLNRTWCQKFMLILPQARYPQQEKSSLQSAKVVPGIADQFSSKFKRLRASEAV